MDAVDPPKWRIASREPFHWRYWDGDYVVFNPLSGQTHLLDIATGNALMLMQAQPRSLPDIRAATADFLKVDDDDKLAAAARDILFRLEDVGLIEPLS